MEEEVTDNSTCKDEVDNEKHFCEVFRNSPVKVILIICCLLFSLLNIALSLGLIWFERFGSDKRRTLLNKLVSSLCYRILQWIIFCQSSDLIRYTFGPMPLTLCAFIVVLKTSIRLQILLLFDMMQITKYIFTFHLKNPSAITEDFWSKFISLLLTMYGYIFCFTLFMVDSRKPVFFYICADADMLPDLKLPKRTYGFPELVSLVLIVCVQAKLLYFKCKPNSPPVFKSDECSLANFRIIFISVGAIGLFSTLAMKTIPLTEADINNYPYFIYMQVLQLLGPNFLYFILSTVYYFNHSQIKYFIYQNIKDHFCIV
jgi:hypothetical protein